MKNIQFYKYQGTGNDFIMIDNRNLLFDGGEHHLITRLCNRRFGIGADGLILIQNHPDCDFEMVYFNADASQSMCGNGSRCAVKFAQKLNIIQDHCTFMAIDGLHEATISNGHIKLKMGDVSQVDKVEDDYYINTGSPHYVKFVNHIDKFPVYEAGKAIRNSEPYKAKGTNVNFVSLNGHNKIFVRTYERGVEDETLSCGTGVTACALAASFSDYVSPVKVETLGGALEIAFLQETDGSFRDIYLSGPAEEVFSGTISI